LPDQERCFQQTIRRWGNSLAVRLPADCLRLRAGDAWHLTVSLHSRCTQLASFDGRMLRAAAALEMGPALD
jgi:antitoxin component of MazEF toxin-antitoxin module